MASFTLTPQEQRFPVGTVVGVYPAASFRFGGSPIASAVTTATTTSNGTAFTGLSINTSYVAYALVGGEHRYYFFKVRPTPGVVTRDPQGFERVIAPASSTAGLVPTTTDTDVGWSADPVPGGTAFFEGGLGVSRHNGSSYPARPANFGTVMWIGPDAPPVGGSGAAANDIWLDTTP